VSDRLDLLIIGAGPAGFAAARAYRELRREGEVAIVGDEHRMRWYGADGRIVGVLTDDADEDDERGSEQIARGARWTW